MLRTKFFLSRQRRVVVVAAAGSVLAGCLPCSPVDAGVHLLPPTPLVTTAPVLVAAADVVVPVPSVLMPQRVASVVVVVAVSPVARAVTTAMIRRELVEPAHVPALPERCAAHHAALRLAR
jgi:hypothetical protein